MRKPFTVASYLVVLFATACALTSCAALDRVVTLQDPVTGETTETTVGDVAAGTVESFAGTVADVAGGAATAATGNPVVGAGLGAALLAAAGAVATGLRRKPKA